VRILFQVADVVPREYPGLHIYRQQAASGWACRHAGPPGRQSPWTSCHPGNWLMPRRSALDMEPDFVRAALDEAICIGVRWRRLIAYVWRTFTAAPGPGGSMGQGRSPCIKRTKRLPCRPIGASEFTSPSRSYATNISWNALRRRSGVQRGVHYPALRRRISWNAQGRVRGIPEGLGTAFRSGSPAWRKLGFEFLSLRGIGFDYPARPAIRSTMTRRRKPPRRARSDQAY